MTGKILGVLALSVLGGVAGIAMITGCSSSSSKGGAAPAQTIASVACTSIVDNGGKDPVSLRRLVQNSPIGHGGDRPASVSRPLPSTPASLR